MRRIVVSFLLLWLLCSSALAFKFSEQAGKQGDQGDGGSSIDDTPVVDSGAVDDAVNFGEKVLIDEDEQGEEQLDRKPKSLDALEGIVPLCAFLTSHPSHKRVNS